MHTGLPCGAERAQRPSQSPVRVRCIRQEITASAFVNLEEFAFRGPIQVRPHRMCLRNEDLARSIAVGARQELRLCCLCNATQQMLAKARSLLARHLNPFFGPVAVGMILGTDPKEIHLAAHHKVKISIARAMLFDNFLSKFLNQYNSHIWRKNVLWKEDCDLAIKR